MPNAEVNKNKETGEVVVVLANGILKINLQTEATILERSHPETHSLIKQGTKYLTCDKDADDATLSSLNSDKGTYGAMIQSWAVIFLPSKGAYLLRNAFGVYLGWDDATLRVNASHAMEPDNSFLWTISAATGNDFFIQSKTGSKFLTSSTTLPSLVLNSSSSEASKWNFDISTTVPPGW